MLNLVLFDMDAQAALDAPRFRHVAEQRVVFDRRTPSSVTGNLEARGHIPLEARPGPDSAHFGTGHIIRRLGRGYEAGSDSRSDGLPAAH
jgi:gamma-glutamyltranspeptidase/glutathione hydrolase